MADAVGDYKEVCCELVGLAGVHLEMRGGGEWCTVSNPILLRIKVM